MAGVRLSISSGDMVNVTVGDLDNDEVVEGVPSMVSVMVGETVKLGLKPIEAESDSLFESLFDEEVLFENESDKDME